MKDEELGCFNPAADLIPREDVTWSDTNLNGAKFDAKFTRLLCRHCGSRHFEVLATGSYETTAQCVKCKMYYIVHSG